ITAVLFSFSKPLNPSRVPDLGNYGYYIDVAGANGTFGTSGDIYIPLSAAKYNPATSTVTVIPSTPLPLNRFERITIDGLANPLLGRGLIDTSGVLLSGLGNGVPGSPFIATFGVGSSLAYSDSLGKTVQISLTRGGLIEMFRTPVGDAQSVVLVGTVPRNSVLTLQANKAGGSTTYMPPIQGAAGVRFLYKPQASAFRLTPLPANRQRIANLFPPADRLYLARRGMRRFHESRIVLQLSWKKQGVILTVTSRKEEHHGLVSRAVDRGRATRRQRGTVLSSQPPY